MEAWKNVSRVSSKSTATGDVSFKASEGVTIEASIFPPEGVHDPHGKCVVLAADVDGQKAALKRPGWDLASNRRCAPREMAAHRFAVKKANRHETLVIPLVRDTLLQDEDGFFWIVMARGVPISIGERSDEDAYPEESDVLNLTQQLIELVGGLFEAGLAIRDFKLSNVVRYRGALVLCDLDLVRKACPVCKEALELGRDSDVCGPCSDPYERRIATNKFGPFGAFGTEGYTPVREEEVLGQLSDIFALGVTIEKLDPKLNLHKKTHLCDVVRQANKMPKRERPSIDDFLEAMDNDRTTAQRMLRSIRQPIQKATPSLCNRLCG